MDFKIAAVSVKWSMSSKLEPAMWSRDTGHIGIYGGVDDRTVVRWPKPNMGYHIFLPIFLRARALRY